MTQLEMLLIGAITSLAGGIVWLGRYTLLIHRERITAEKDHGLELLKLATDHAKAIKTLNDQHSASIKDVLDRERQLLMGLADRLRRPTPNPES